MNKHYLFTGMTSVGKTTLLRRVVQALPVVWRGFFSSNIFEQNKKIGRRFDSLNGFSLTVFKPEIIPYSITELESFFESAFHSVQPGDYLVMDEIGSWICRSPVITDRIEAWLDCCRLFAVIARRGHSFIERLQCRSDVVVIHITGENRDTILADILRSNLYKGELS